MRVFAKLLTAARGGMREAAETVVDANALRIFAQEIHECESALQRAKQDLACVVAERLRLAREIGALEASTAEKEAQAVAVLRAGEEALAREVVELIAEQERVLAQQRQRHRELEAHEARLQRSLRAAIQKVKDYRRDLNMAQAMASSQRALRALDTGAATLGCRFEDLQDSLERIQCAQADFADRFEALERINRNISDEGLNDRIKAAVSGAESGPVESILQRIRDTVAKQKEGDESDDRIEAGGPVSPRR